MKNYLRVHLALVAIVITGCSTGPFLKPTAISGSYSTVNPACPGAQEVIEFSQEKQPWVLLRIYATPPGRWNSKGTELRVHFWFRYGKGISTGMWSAIFPTDEQRKLIEERINKDYLITVSKPTATVVLPNGSKRELLISIFEKPYNPKYDRIDWWANGEQVSPDKLDSFTVIFPNIYVNGEKIDVPPVHFQRDEDRYTPVLNC